MLEEGSGEEVWGLRRLCPSNRSPLAHMLSPPWLLALILAIAGLACLPYLSRVFRPRIDTNRRASLKKDPELWTIAPSFEHQEAESLVSGPMVPELLLRLRRVVQNERWIVCLFVNEGRLIMNLSVTADHRADTKRD